MTLDLWWIEFDSSFHGYVTVEHVPIGIFIQLIWIELMSTFIYLLSFREETSNKNALNANSYFDHKNNV